MTQSVGTLQATDHHSHKVIVVVDDDEEIGTLITELIHAHTTHRVRYHISGNQALQELRNSTPHLCILDFHLPDMSGLELHDRLHTFEHLRSVPTLLISSVKPPLSEVRKRAITFLSKPFDLMELLRTITTLLT